MIRAEILDRAKHAVTKGRAASHGQPEDTFGVLALLWSSRLGKTISPAQVCIMLVDLKTVRAWGNPNHADNWDDMAGYAACGGELAAIGSSDGDLIAVNRGWRLPQFEASASDTEAVQKLPPEPPISLPLDTALDLPVSAVALAETKVDAGVGVDQQAVPVPEVAKPVPAYDVPRVVEPAPSASVKPAPWTAEEDASAVAIYVDALARGLKIRAAQELVAQSLGRPSEGTKSRLSKQLAIAITQARLVAPSVAPKVPAQSVAARLLPSGKMPLDAALPAIQRVFRDHLNLMGNPAPFTRGVDFGIVSDLARGMKLDFIATDLGIDSKLLLQRWMAMIEHVVTPRGGISLDDQKHLLAELKARMLAKVGAAK